MRKITLLGLWALALTVLSHEQANAWINFKFGVGLNWNWQSGGNNTLWGLFRNGQPPGSGPTFDPSVCPPVCGNSGGGWGNPYGGYGGYGPGGMNQPGCGSQQPPCMQQSPCSTLPSTAPQRQQCPCFPGFHPFRNDEFQYFGGSTPTPSNASTDASPPQIVTTAQAGYPQYQYQAAYFSPYAGATYYPSYPTVDPYYYNNYYYQSYYSPYSH